MVSVASTDFFMTVAELTRLLNRNTPRIIVNFANLVCFIFLKLLLLKSLRIYEYGKQVLVNKF